MRLFRTVRAIAAACAAGVAVLGSVACSEEEPAAAPPSEPVTLYKSYLYIADSAGDRIYGYELDDTTGAIKDQTKGSPYSTGDTPVFIAKHPTLDYLYVVNRTGRTISVFEIAPKTGKLTEISGSPYDLTATSPDSVFPHPDGEYILVLEQDTGIEAFKVDAVSGELTEEVNSVTPTAGFTYSDADDNRANHVGFDSTGAFMLTANHDDDTMGSFLFDLSQPDLDLRARTGSPYAGGNGPRWLAVHPTAPYVWAVNSLEDTIHQFTIDAEDGFLFDRVSYGTGANPYRIELDPEGKVLLVVNRDSAALSVYSVDATEGTIQVKPPIATSTDPNRLAVHPEGIAAYVLSTTSLLMDVFSLKTSNGTVAPLGTEDLSDYSPEFVTAIRIAQP